MPIIKRCLLVAPDDALCRLELGDLEATAPFCDFEAARLAYDRIIQSGGFTDVRVKAIESARTRLKHLDVPQIQRDLYHCSPVTEASPEARAQDTASRFGTGFYVSDQGYILTNDHVVRGCKKLVTRDGKILALVNSNITSDLALLKTGTTPKTVAIFRLGPPPKVGDMVVVYGFPLPSILSSEGNVTEGILNATTGLGDNPNFVQISAPVQPGDSGGPLLDSSGHVIGVVVAKLDASKVAKVTGDVPQNVNFAVHWSEVRAFLDEGGVTYRKATSVEPARVSAIADAAKGFTVAIECAE